MSENILSKLELYNFFGLSSFSQMNPIYKQPSGGARFDGDVSGSEWAQGHSEPATPSWILSQNLFGTWKLPELLFMFSTYFFTQVHKFGSQSGAPFEMGRGFLRLCIYHYSYELLYHVRTKVPRFSFIRWIIRKHAHSCNHDTSCSEVMEFYGFQWNSMVVILCYPLVN